MHEKLTFVTLEDVLEMREVLRQTSRAEIFSSFKGCIFLFFIVEGAGDWVMDIVYLYANESQSDIKVELNAMRTLPPQRRYSEDEKQNVKRTSLFKSSAVNTN